MYKKLSSEFSTSPFGRSKIDSKNNGTKFRELHLKDWVSESVNINEKLIIDLNDLDIPMTSSFMEESFGGMVRFGYVDRNILLNVLSFESDDPSYIQEIEDYISDAEYSPDAVMYEM